MVDRHSGVRPQEGYEIVRIAVERRMVILTMLNVVGLLLLLLGRGNLLVRRVVWCYRMEMREENGLYWRNSPDGGLGLA